MNRREQLVFVKLGGSVITDKTRSEVARPEVISRLGQEIARALEARPDLRLVLGHGSGSFGHMAARRHGTRQGVQGPTGWQGFVEVAAVAARLNRIVTDLLLAAGVPVWSLQPSASARCKGGELSRLDVFPVERALKQALVPLVHGDVGLDEVQGGTIISTEQIFGYLARRLSPDRLVLVGVVGGVHERDPLQDASARPIPLICAENWRSVQSSLSGSHATDVTGGMLAKVEEMVSLARDLPGLSVRLISGEQPGVLEMVLRHPEKLSGGTEIRWE
jgi:isopentenyl phosphate kinase